MRAWPIRMAAAIAWLNGWSRRPAVRRLCLALTLTVVVPLCALWLFRFAIIDERARFGVDFLLYRGATIRWLEGGSFYPPDQIAGPFDAFGSSGLGVGIMYPPIALLLLVPFAYLPPIMWWAVSMVLAVAGIGRLRPAPWTWPLLATFMLSDNAVWLVLSGNPAIWGFAALAWLDRGWPTLFFVLKPSLLPLAFPGAARRSWWVGLAGIVAVGVLILPMWSDWVAVAGNARTGRGLLYSVVDLPLLLVPLIAHLGRTSSPSRVHTAEVVRGES